MKLDPRPLLASLPGPVTPKWPDGERFIEAFSRAEKNLRESNGKMKHIQPGQRFLRVTVLPRADNSRFDFFPLR